MPLHGHARRIRCCWHPTEALPAIGRQSRHPWPLLPACTSQGLPTQANPTNGSPRYSLALPPNVHSRPCACRPPAPPSFPPPKHGGLTSLEAMAPASGVMQLRGESACGLQAPLVGLLGTDAHSAVVNDGLRAARGRGQRRSAAQPRT
jgi:hypothetical protein